MWLKQDESKTTSPSPAVKESPRVAPPPPAIASVQAREAVAPAGHLTSTLIIKGEITGREDLFIDGEVQGKIHLDDGKVTIGPNGRVTADIEAREIVIRGKLKGNVNGRDRVQIGPTGRAMGDIHTRRISIEEGAELHGNVDIARAEELRPSRVTPPVAADSEMPLPLALHAKESPAGA